MEDIRPEMDQAIEELKKRGIHYNVTDQQVVGLGDIVESVLTSVGITQERFKSWFGLKECNCTERKKYLNNLFSWHINKKNDQTNT